MSTAAVAVELPRDTVVSRDWEKIGNAVVLLLYSGVVLFTVRYHEKWADEAQAWLIARDLDLKTIWFHELRYEGSPGLWHTILWIAQHVFHLPYAALGYIGLSFAIAGVAVLLYATPFPYWIRWMMAFSFYFLYQYAVVARSYTLFALLCLIVARQYRKLEQPLAFAASLVPLAILTAHGSLLAFALAVSYAVRFVRGWRSHQQKARHEFIVAACFIALLYLALFLILLPASDVEAMHGQHITLLMGGYRVKRALEGALFENILLSLLVFSLFGLWCFLQKSFIAFILPVALMISLFVYADGWQHQAGTIFLAIVTGLAISWPDYREVPTLSQDRKLAYRLMAGSLGVVLAYQIGAAFFTIYRDTKLPYSGAQDMVEVLAPLVSQGVTVDGYQYGVVAISAYFDHNIFSNWPHSYYHHAEHEFDFTKVAEQMRTSTSSCQLINWWDQFDEKKFDEGLRTPLAGWGYKLVHVSDGYLFTKTGYSHRQIYFLFCRPEVTSEQTQPTLNPDK